MELRLRYYILSSVLLAATYQPAFSQGIKLSYVPKTVTRVDNNFTPSLNYKMLNIPGLPVNTHIPIQNGIHYTAFFCRMESKVYDKLNLWVKLRAGNDEEYRKFYGSDNP